MRKRARIIEQEKLEKARAFELAADFPQAIKTYRSVLSGNPVHLKAASRLLILLRKTKDSSSELKLLKALIRAQKEHLETVHQNWITKHPGLAEDTAPLAKILGLIGKKNQPIPKDEILNKWQARLLALEKRLNAKGAKARVKSRLKKSTAALKQKSKYAKATAGDTTRATSPAISPSKPPLNKVKQKLKKAKTKAGDKAAKPLIKKR
ncbi:hypothetical protein ACS5PU_16810 [Pedobacter sp. GSP4]|uniref:hypothetical protein n=1 Tax=Pedobacter sp. GSP4 TaxID=3453716 RepID=UPI003EEF2F37